MEYRKLARKLYTYDELPDEVKNDVENASCADEHQLNIRQDLVWELREIPVDVSIFDDYPDPEEWFETSGYEMQNLIEDIKKNGVRVPVIVGPCGFEGHHRMWAAYMAGLKTIPAYVYEYTSRWDSQ